MTLKIGTWNVNGIRAREREVADWLSREAPDVVCLQELKAAADQIPLSIYRLPDYWCYWHGAKAYSGVALLVAKRVAPEAPEFSHPAFDRESRIAVVKLPSGMAVASVYVPNGGKNLPDKLQFLEAMVGFAESFRANRAPLVVAGDLNVARSDMDVHPKERKPGAIGQMPEERVLFERMLGEGLRDVQRALAPDDANLFTWWAPWRNLRQRNIGWRIDYVLASEHLRPTTCVSFREVGTSDHAPVVAAFETGPGNAGAEG